MEDLGDHRVYAVTVWTNPSRESAVVQSSVTNRTRSSRVAELTALDFAGQYRITGVFALSDFPAGWLGD